MVKVLEDRKITKAGIEDVTKQVDFTKEQVVWVGWGSAGPPFATLEHKTREAKNGKEIVFYLHHPKGPIAKSHRNFVAVFAVTAKIKVSLELEENMLKQEMLDGLRKLSADPANRKE